MVVMVEKMMILYKGQPCCNWLKATKRALDCLRMKRLAF